MTTIITTLHGSTNRGTRQYATEMSVRLSRYFRRILTIRWNLDQEGPHYRATCRIHAQSGFYRVRAMADTFRDAIHAAEETLARQRRRRKEVQVTMRSRAGVAAADPAEGCPD